MRKARTQCPYSFTLMVSFGFLAFYALTLCFSARGTSLHEKTNQMAIKQRKEGEKKREKKRKKTKPTGSSINNDYFKLLFFGHYFNFLSQLRKQNRSEKKLQSFDLKIQCTWKWMSIVIMSTISNWYWTCYILHLISASVQSHKKRITMQWFTSRIFYFRWSNIYFPIRLLNKEEILLQRISSKKSSSIFNCSSSQ